MTDTNEPQYRHHYRADPDDVELREEEDDGMFTIRMPIASTGEVRNEGDDPLTREEIDGMAQQLEERQIGVFPQHGRDGTIAPGRYSPFEKLGFWTAGEVEERDGVDLLVAEARMPDPDTLPETTGAYRQGLSILKEQAARGISQDASIGWRDDDSHPGGVDLMETSIVGIGADWRTNSETAQAMARTVVMAANGEPELRHLSEEQRTVARQLVDDYREAQGDGSVGNFERWLFNVAWHEYDENQFHAAMTALEEFFRETTPMEDPVSDRFIPFLNGDDSGNENMTQDTDTGDGGNEPDDTQDDNDDLDVNEYREQMLAMQETQTELLQSIVDDENAGDDDGEDDDEEDEQDADEPDAEQESDDSDEPERSMEDLEAEIRDLREQLNAAEPEDPDGAERDSDENNETETEAPSFSFAEAN